LRAIRARDRLQAGSYCPASESSSQRRPRRAGAAPAKVVHAPDYSGRNFWGRGRFGLRGQSEAATPLLPPAEPKPMVPARASHAAKAVAPSGGCRTLPPQSKTLQARALGRGTSRAREQRLKSLA